MNKKESKEVLKERVCRICSKVFIPAPKHIYKVKGAFVCSWNCVRKYEREREKEKAK